MPSQGEHADILRAVGRLLERERARNVEIVNHDTFLSISWETPSQGADQQHYQEHELQALRDQAKQMRKGMPQDARGVAELLRTLGQEIDGLGIELANIVQERDGFVVSGSSGGRYVRKKFETEALLALGRRRRLNRNRGPGSSGAGGDSPLGSRLSR